MKKLFIATPAYDGKVNIEYSLSLCETNHLLQSNGIGVRTVITTDNALVAQARNELLSFFMKSDCTHIMFIDSDIGWNSSDIMSMILLDKPFLSAVYHTRVEPRRFPFTPTIVNDKLVIDENQFINADRVPGGFMMMKKELVACVIQQNPQLAYKKHGESFTALFNTELIDGEYVSEDFVFCDRVRKCGFELKVIPSIELSHAGHKARLSNYLK